jgi:hypothetical protein
MATHAKAQETGMMARLGSTFDPFRAHHPAILVHDVGAMEFDAAWAACIAHSSATACPICHKGTPAECGHAPSDDRAWIRFSCGDVIAEEQSAG